MKGLLLLIAVVVCCVEAVRYAKPSFVRHAEHARARNERRRDLWLKKQKRGEATPQDQWFVQRRNHFGRSEGTWKQRYWVNDQYFNAGTPGPLFVQLGEEAEAGPWMATDMAMTSYGAKHGALLVAIEHRFYGASQPSGNFADLSLLSVDQGLADFATVIAYLKQQYNTTDTVVFGCSYIGSGAAWFRAKYPQVAVGAVASSAPVRATVDFFQYLDQVDESIREQFGPQCDANLRSGFHSIVQLLQQGQSGGKQLQQIFQLCAPPVAPLDQSNFVSDVMGTIMEAVQYDFESPTTSVDYICQTMANASSPMAGLATLMTQGSGGQCTDVSYAGTIAQLANITYDPTQNMRQWTYQTCTEFGYFQTTTSQSQPFAEGNYVPVSFYDRMCSDAFKTTFNTTANVIETNIRFGGNQLPPYYATNIAYDNSLVDPWHTLSVQADVNPQSPLFVYQHRGHCAAVSPPQPNDPPSIVQVRNQISSLIEQWIVQ